MAIGPKRRILAVIYAAVIWMILFLHVQVFLPLVIKKKRKEKKVVDPLRLLRQAASESFVALLATNSANDYNLKFVIFEGWLQNVI